MKALKETTGYCRVHKIQSISDELIAHVIIYREGIDGEYDINVNDKDNDKAIEYLKTLPEYADFEIVEE